MTFVEALFSHLFCVCVFRFAVLLETGKDDLFIKRAQKSKIFTFIFNLKSTDVNILSL